MKDLEPASSPPSAVRRVFGIPELVTHITSFCLEDYDGFPLSMPKDFHLLVTELRRVKVSWQQFGRLRGSEFAKLYLQAVQFISMSWWDHEPPEVEKTFNPSAMEDLIRICPNLERVVNMHPYIWVHPRWAINIGDNPPVRHVELHYRASVTIPRKHLGDNLLDVPPPIAWSGWSFTTRIFVVGEAKMLGQYEPSLADQIEYKDRLKKIATSEPRLEGIASSFGMVLTLEQEKEICLRRQKAGLGSIREMRHLHYPIRVDELRSFARTCGREMVNLVMHSSAPVLRTSDLPAVTHTVRDSLPRLEMLHLTLLWAPDRRLLQPADVPSLCYSPNGTLIDIQYPPLILARPCKWQIGPFDGRC